MKKFSTKFLIGLILIVGFLVYVNALPNGFVWDDEEQIAKNLVIRDWSNLPLVFTSSTFYGGGAGLSGGFYRPLVTLSYFLNYHVWGLNPFGFRLSQLLFHLANLILIFLILRKIFLSQNIKYGDEISALATLLFAVHPANVESVAYLGSIGEVLYVFFTLLAFWFFLKNRFYLGFLFSFCGLFSKETSLIVFPLFALYLFIFIKPKIKMWLRYIAGSTITIGTYLFLRLYVAKLHIVLSYFSPISEASFLQRIQTIPYELFSYLKTIFFPKNLYIAQQFVVSSASDIRFWGSLIFLLLIFALVGFYIWKTKSKVGAFFPLWFLGAFVPVSNIIVLDMTIAERWLYFPMIGLLAFLSYIIFQFKDKLPSFARKILFFVIILALLMLGIRTIIRNSDWKDSLTLFSHDIKYSKNSFDLENNYGVALFREGNYDEAMVHFKKSMELQPGWTFNHNNLCAVFQRQGKLEEALVECKKSMGLEDYYLAYENTGVVLIKLQRLDEAEDFLSNALLKFPHNANLKWQLALVYYLKGYDEEKSISLLYGALNDDPQNISVQQVIEIIQKGLKVQL